MANVKISQLPALSSLSGDDVLPVVNGNVTYKVTANAIADFVGGGGGANTGNVTFDNVTVQGQGAQLFLSPDPDFTANLSYVRVRAGDVASHIHMDTGDNTIYDLFLGDDSKHVQVSSTGNIIMQSYDSGNTIAYTMTLDTTGNLSVPTNINFNGGQGIFQAVDNDFNISIQDPTSDGYRLLMSVGDNAGNNFTQTSLGADTFRVYTDLQGAAYQWSFDNAGRINLPDGGNIQGAYGGNSSYYAIDNGSSGAVEMKVLSYVGDSLIANIRVSNPNVTISTGGGANTWTFDNTGTLTIPGNIAVDSITTVPVTNENGNPSGPGVATITTQTDANPAASTIQIGWTVTGNNLVGTTTVTAINDLGGGLLEFVTDTAVTDPFWYNDEYTFTGVNSAAVWNLNGNGILTLPGEGVIRSNNDTIILQSYDVANSIGRGLRIGTTGQLFLEQGTDPAWLSIVANSANAEITAAIGTGGAGGHNLTITAGAADQTDYYTTPGGNVNITGGLGAFNDGGGGGPGGDVNLTSGASADPAGHNGNVTVNTGGANTWTFDYTGNLTLPGNTFSVNYANGTPVSIGGSLGNLSASGNTIFLPDSPQPASFVNYNTGSAMVLGTNSALPVNIVANYTSNAAQTWTFGTDGSLTAPGDISVGGNIGVTGNATVSGTDSNLIRRAFGLVAADTYITLDDLKARVTSSTNQLSLILTTGSWQGTGWTESFTGGGSAIINSWINLPLSSGFDNASLAMNSQGNGCRCIISDQTPNAKVYQITVVRSGTTGAQWNISIERLV